MEHVFPRTNRRESQKTRLLYGIAGGSMLLYGMKHRSFFGGLISLAGADLVTRGLTGRHLHETLGITSRKPSEPSASIPHQVGVNLRRSVTVALPPEEAYEFVRDIENLPQFMKHLKSVEAQDDTHSHWCVSAPGGAEVEWDAEISSDILNELIAWRSIGNPNVDASVSIGFKNAPQGRGTVIHVSLQYVPRAGVMGVVTAEMFGKDPEIELKDNLRRLKQILETGEITTTRGQPVGGLRGRQEVERRREQAASQEPSRAPSDSEPGPEPDKSRAATASGSSQ
ncbi:MAG: SRPBCC family protein [Candidatus Acidiferrales bacterium]